MNPDHNGFMGVPVNVPVPVNGICMGVHGYVYVHGHVQGPPS